MGLKGQYKRLGKRGKVWGPWDRQGSDQRWLVPDSMKVVKGESGERLVGWTRPEIPDSPPYEWESITATDDGEMFDRFLELSDPDTPDDALDFVRRYGVPDLTAEKPLPLNEVVRMSTDARMLMILAVGLEQGERQGADVWRKLLDAHFPNADKEAVSERADSHAEQDLEAQRLYLTWYLDDWLRDGGIRLKVARQDGAFRVKPAHRNTLLGALARQLFLIIVGDAGIAVCHGCGTIFTPNRKPAKGRRSWCEDCGKGSDYKAAKRLSARQ